MTISTTHEAGTECPPTEADEVIIKVVMVDGVTIILQNEDADYWLLPGAVEEMVHTFMTTGFKSLQVHPAFRRQVRAIASRQFKAAYGAGYMEREDWRRLFGAGTDEADGLPPPVAHDDGIWADGIRRHAQNDLHNQRLPSAATSFADHDLGGLY